MNKTDCNRKYAMFFDIDGTIINHGDFPEANKRMLAAAHNAGHLLFINTGRSRGNMPGYITDTGFWTGFCCGGAYAEVNGEILINKTMSESVFIRLLDFLDINNLGCAVECTKAVYVYNTTRWGFTPISRRELTDMFPSIEITKVTFDRRLDDLTILTDFNLIQFPDYTEAMLKDCNKAAIMDSVIKKLGIPRENTVSFGDSLNDLEMMQYTKISVAMAHSPQEIRDISDLVTESPETGVAEALQKLFGLSADSL